MRRRRRVNGIVYVLIALGIFVRNNFDNICFNKFNKFKNNKQYNY